MARTRFAFRIPLGRSRLDRIGVALSALCVGHCLAGLVIVAGLGATGSVLLHPAVHELGLLLATVIVALAIGLGALRAPPGPALPVALLGLAAMAAALLVGHGPRETMLTLIGVALVAGAHLINLRRAASLPR